MVFKNKTYDVMKWIAQYVLPAAGTLYAALAKIWGFPYGNEIVGTVSAVDIFLGVLLGISKSNYDGEGTLTVNSTDPNKDLYNLDLNIPVDELPSRKEITFKVVSEDK